MKFGHEKNFYYKNPWECILKKKKTIFKNAIDLILKMIV